ncbi:MAG: hypothetical protein KDA99_23305 [Planctomycetales bacterium]|nr:hypothetical protein [Planctomycetales bacterium]
MHRWYDNQTGRWISEDPIGFAAGDANLTRYVGNKAVSSLDSEGLQEGGETTSLYVADGNAFLAVLLIQELIASEQARLGEKLTCHDIELHTMLLEQAKSNTDGALRMFRDAVLRYQSEIEDNQHSRGNKEPPQLFAQNSAAYYRWRVEKYREWLDSQSHLGFLDRTLGPFFVPSHGNPMDPSGANFDNAIAMGAGFAAAGAAAQYRVPRSRYKGTAPEYSEAYYEPSSMKSD